MSYVMALDLDFRYVLKPTLSLTKPALLQCRSGDSVALKHVGHLASFLFINLRHLSLTLGFICGTESSTESTGCMSSVETCFCALQI
jgi:hypothetical protein